jgi:hypothetical protein
MSTLEDTTHSNGAKPRAYTYEAWEALSPEKQFAAVLGWPPSDWVKEPALSVLAAAWGHPIRRADMTITWKEQAPFVPLKVLADAIDHWRTEMGMGIDDDDPAFTTYIPRQEGDSAIPSTSMGNPFTTSTTLTTYPWPVLAPEAFYGLAGDFVSAIAPHSESDPAALLIQFLTTFGLVIGRKRYYQIEATRHYTNLFTVVAGLTSRARKGTSYAHIEAQMQTADPSWTLANHIKGCGSGEGLIYAVRDERRERQPRKKDGSIVDYQEVIVDAGISDKRALYQTGEFTSILKVCAREGNTLSEVLRDLWDTGFVRNATKNSPLTATGAHVGIIGHVTIAEIQRLLTSTDAANGFANRFLWICARRSKELPDGGNISSVDFQALMTRLRDALAFGKQPGQMYRDPQAKAAWHAVYGLLSEDRTGLANTLLARAEAQVLRLSMLYALLDCSATIRHEHLNAALALWQYAEDSAAAIFGEATGDETADIILSALEKAGAEGLSRNTLVQEVFQRNTAAKEVHRALALLLTQERITMTKRAPIGQKGRPCEVYSLPSHARNVVNVVNTSRYLIASNDAVKTLSFTTVKSPDMNVVNTPCAVCEGTERWDDHGTLRCVACYPPHL